MFAEKTQPDDIMRAGHLACPGCGHAIGVRMVLKALGNRAVGSQLVAAAGIAGCTGCSTIYRGIQLHS